MNSTEFFNSQMFQERGLPPARFICHSSKQEMYDDLLSSRKVTWFSSRHLHELVTPHVHLPPISTDSKSVTENKARKGLSYTGGSQLAWPVWVVRSNAPVKSLIYHTLSSGRWYHRVIVWLSTQTQPLCISGTGWYLEVQSMHLQSRKLPTWYIAKRKHFSLWAV